MFESTKSSEDEIESFYKHLNEALSLVKKVDNIIVMDDFNAKVGKKQCQIIVGGFGMGRRNDRGDRIIQFCQENDHFITNTFFKLHQRRLYTWTSTAETEDMIVSNQIDFILVKQRFRNSIKSAKTYPEADIGSDHNPLVAITHIRLKKIDKKQSQNSTDRTLLSKEPMRSMVREQLHKCLETHNENATDSDTQWNKMRTDINNLCQKHLKSKTQNKK
ncbi:craniofacial development protein 2-like [Dendroctonus ponderosae]|uniref:Endonuclease/exonuclease/phosphatase domain-containing protein n=1 Tax=Dendroctonus ponderosae TaxID=77166 RepID=A0AAR5PZJ2_DENPD|nr:craniofacial development protein 2-like [Dendroctonus ponderosae]